MEYERNLMTIEEFCKYVGIGKTKAREMISKVQNIRKENDYNIIDRINLYYKGDEEVDEAVNKFDEFIKKETLAINISVKEGINNSYDLNGHEVFIETEKR